MASSFSDLGIELMATGENAGTWGDKTNTNLQIVEKSIAGYVEQAVTSGGTTALTITDGDATESTSVARHAVIKLTGTITGNSIVTVPDSIEKVYIVTNGTSGAYTVQFKTASGTGITFGVSEKTTKLVYSDGTNLVDAGFGGALDIEGRELVLDADGDTTLTADTDDQIDIKIAGADDFQFTANTFTAQSGSSIVVPEGGLTFGSTAITSTAAELNILDGVTSTTAELNLIDGGTSAGTTAVADADGIITNDGGTMRLTTAATFKTYFQEGISTAYDDLTTGDAAVNIATSAGDITIDAQGNDTDIILKGTDGSADTTFLTIDGSAAGKATFNSDVVVGGDLTVSGDDIVMATNTAGNLLIADGTNFNSVAAGSLSEISTVADDDVFIAVDTSGGGLKKIARSTIVSGLATSSAISNVVDDTSPQLGGDLDMNGQDIVTTSNANIELAPNGTGTVVIKGNTNQGALVLNCENNSHGQKIQPQPHSVGSSAVHTLPNITGDLIAGKIEGTNFTDSLLVGHATTGTLNAAQDNTGVGIGALNALTSGDGNTAVGSEAGGAINSGIRNSIIGNGAGDAITTGDQNTAVGFNSLTTNISSDKNTFVGAYSGENTTGGFNIGIGKSAGGNITSGSGNVVIGSDTSVSSATGSRQLVISGNDGSTATTWISGDNSGNLTFAGDVTVGDDLNLTTDSAVINFGADSDTTLTHTDGTGLTLNSANKLTFRDTGLTIGSNADGDLDIVSDGTAVDSINIESGGGITLDAGTAGSGIIYEDDGTEMARMHNSSSDVILETKVSDKDFLIKGNDGGSTITALTLDMSDAGAATFNDKVTIGDGKLVLNSTAVTSTAAELNLLDGVSGLVQADLTKLAAVDSTAAELNIVDGGTSATSTTLVDADRFVVNDNGTMVQVAASDVKTYIGGGTSWQAVKTSNFTASAGQGVFANTTSSAFTVGRNSSKIFGADEDLVVSTERAAFTLVFTDSTQGWLFKND
jgi:hypothetical protein